MEYRQKRLTLGVENATWKRHLEDLSGDILYRLNVALGQGIVTFIEFRVDKAAVDAASGRSTARRNEVDTENAVSPSLIKAAGNILDEGLRERFLDAAGAYLSRQNI